MADDVEARLDAAVPAHVREVCARLAGAGHEAVAVGGAVRDVLLGRPPGDWDVATSAHPDEVSRLFRHTIPTGIQHGTVTVVTGKGVHTHVEVTTFRGEGAYTDARRPDHVVFGVPLYEDLLRRDLVVNAMAYDVAGHRLVDPFGGREDITHRRLRAVGDAVARFTEDGLRVMRAVRFAAQLEFELDAATEAAIAPALPSLARVSRERVCVELRKLLAAPQPSRGLRIAHRAAIVRTVLPELDAALAARAAAGAPGAVEAWLGQVDRAIPEARLAAFMAPLARPDAPPRALDRGTARHVGGLLHGLKFSNAECDLAGALVAVAHAPATPAWSPPEVRRLLASLDRARREPAVALWAAAAAPNAALVEEARRVLAAGEPLAIGDLAITGAELIRALGLAPGPVIGKLLAALLERVLDDPGVNDHATLVATARELAAQS